MNDDCINQARPEAHVLLMERDLQVSVRRLNNGRLDAVAFQNPVGTRMLVRCFPTQINDQFELGLIDFGLQLPLLEDERPLNAKRSFYQPVGVKLIVTEYETRQYNVGFMVSFESFLPMIVMAGDPPGSLAMQCSGAKIHDFSPEFQLDEYSLIEWPILKEN